MLANVLAELAMVEEVERDALAEEGGGAHREHGEEVDLGQAAGGDRHQVQVEGQQAEADGGQGRPEQAPGPPVEREEQGPGRGDLPGLADHQVVGPGADVGGDVPGHRVPLVAEGALSGMR